ncbi:MAG: hypothetical protein JWO73_708 [Candidatus Taylorbacteria bacterium]|nr:hypothetical protein [Candidatus Taylorbacteria bacterium]
MNIDIHNLHKSKKFQGVIVGILLIIVLLVIFQAGVFVGYHKAAFSYRSGESYYRAFDREKKAPSRVSMGSMMNPFDQNDFAGSHGAVGKVVRTASTTIIVADVKNIEKSVLIDNNTIIRKFHDTVAAGDIAVDDTVIVIGTPNEQGQVVAKLIRILPPPPEAAGIMAATSSIK